VGLGEILWDILPAGRQLGGAPANFAYHAMALGGQSRVVSAVGEDALGREILAKIKGAGLDPRFIAVDPEHPTGTVTVKLDPAGVPDFTIHESVAWDYIPFSAELEELASRTDAVCFGTLAQRSQVSRSTIRRFLECTPPDCLRIYDVNLRQAFFDRDILHESLVRCDVLKLNDLELPVLAGALSITGTGDERIRQLLGNYELELIALTLGAKGSRLVGPDTDSFMEAPAVRIADTVGAGDAFTAALAVGMLRLLPLRRIHENATRLAAFVCTLPGAMPEMGLVKEALKSFAC
jgi:fructokinase